ncbi:hypothetical protein [Roseibium sp.]|uniref:hypothetical protein n=1 Tax=Roseibium sp. TaxID=1936156 RepID=UPI003D0DB694
MTTLLILFGFFLIAGIGFYFIERSKEGDHPKRHRQWQPDVDQSKAATMKNHDPGGMNR